ncbi:MAG: DUF86 domain-containing protein [Deltaproteobacteria bacterium]|jgi:uncharacterized protein with HEPN domain|nr:DUF86 domain-containing protein [Deltaproteobacteria bacterium]
MESARLALDYVKGKTRVEFFDDLQCQDAVIRRLEIIGEAANRISKEYFLSLYDHRYIQS